MNEQNQTFDNYPLLNSFLTTIHEHEPTTTHKEFSPRETLQPIRKKAEEWFQGILAIDSAESKALHAKRERELMKQNRLKQLEEEFEAQRIKKQKEIDQKFANIEKNKIKNLTHIQQKLHQLSARHSKVLTKVQEDHLKQIQQQYNSRKTYELESSRRSSRIINTSQHSASGDRHRTLRESKAKTLEKEQIDYKINQISQRLNHATTMYKERKNETVSKARNHNVIQLYQVQIKAKEYYEDYLKLSANKILSKMQNAEQNKEKLQKNLQKKNEQRQNAYNKKLKRIQTNLIQLQEQQQQKFQQLSKKLVSPSTTQQKSSSNDKGGKEHRETLYRKHFLHNLQQLQRQKLSKADQIIQKHQQITLKNRLFKQKKQALHKKLEN